MTLTQLLAVVRARWRSALLVWVAVLALVLGATLLRTPLYTGAASVMLDVKSPDPIAGMVLPGMTAGSYMGTQISVVRSERVLVRAVRALGLADQPALREAWQQDTGGQGVIDAWIAQQVLRRLDTTPVRDSNVIEIAYDSPDPAQAAAVVNAIVDAYIDTTLDLRVEPARRYSEFFEASARRLRSALEAAQERLSAYQQQNGLVATDERLDVEGVRLSELTTQLVALESQANESASRERQATSRAAQMQEVLGNPLLVGLNTELARQEARLDELRTRLGSAHPQVQELSSSIEQQKNRIARETGRVAASVRVSDDVNRGRLERLRADVEAQRQKMLTLRSQHDRASVLLRDVESARSAYEATMARAVQAGIEGQATQTNVSVLQRAGVPALPSSPRWKLTAAVAALAGALLGIATAVLRELRDSRLRDADDVVKALRQPLLGVLPRQPRSPAPGGQRLRLLAPAGQRPAGR